MMNLEFKFYFKFLILFHLSSLIKALNESIQLNPNEIFIIPIRKTGFNPKLTKDDKLLITASLNGMPDLPDNVYFKQKDSTKDAILFGLIENDQDTEFEFIAKQLTTYEIYKCVIKLSFTSAKDREPKNQVEMKINNLNIEDMQARKDEIVNIFKNFLWTNTTDLFITMIASPLDVNHRAPLNPKSKEGVVLRLSSKSEFSNDLLLIDRETEPVKNRIPCPSKYRSISMEHAFKQRNLQIDWCSFRLIKKNNYSFN